MSKYKEEEETNIRYLDSLDLDRFVELSNDVVLSWMRFGKFSMIVLDCLQNYRDVYLIV